MNFINKLIWKLVLPRADKQSSLSSFNVVDRNFYKGILSGRSFADIFHETQSILVHVPKCAGTSIGDAFYEGGAGGHQTARWYQERFPEEYEQYFTYAFIRNPWDRLASAWFYLRNRTGHKKDGGWADLLNQYGDFNTFVAEWLWPENVVRHYVFAPQYLFICDKFGTVSLDYVGQLETLSRDFQYVARRLNSNATLPKLNQSKNRDYRALYNDKSVEQVAEVYKHDLQLFDYSFGG